MKKTLLIVLSIVLCVSMLTGCFSSFKEEAKEDIKNNNVETAKPNTDSNNTDTPVDRANMQVAIDSFNKIDLSAFGEIPTDYVETLKELINEVAFALELEAEGDFDEKGEFSADVKMKDGKFYFDIVGHGEGEEENGIKSFIVFDSNTLDTYANFIADGESEGWVKHTQDISEITGQLAAAYNPEMISELLGKVVITKLEEKYLTKKDDMLLLSNDYIIDLVVANIPLIEELSGEEIADDEIAEFKEDAKESFEEVGLEIYLGTGVDSITKLAVSAKEDDDSFYAELALTDDATALDHVTVKVKTELGEGDLKYAPETIITVKSVYDEEGNAVGLDVDGTVYASLMSHWDYEEAGDSTEKITKSEVVQKISVDGILDFGAIGKTSADIFKLDVNVEPVKVIESVVLENWETGESQTISVQEGNVSEYDEKMSLFINLKSENENKITFKFEMDEGDYVVAANGEAAVSDKTLSFKFNASEDGEKVFSLDGSVTFVDDSTVTFKLNVNVEDEGYINFDGKLYVGEDVVLPAFPTDYEVVENNPLFGSVDEPEYIPEYEPMQTETEKFPDNAE